MHPILTQGRRLSLYLFLFLQAGVLLAEILVRGAGALRIQALALVVPAMLVHGFSCLASWYLCRTLPLATVRLDRLLVTHGVAGAAASGLLVSLAHLWGRTLDAQELWPGSAQLAQDGAVLIFVFALLLYSLVVAVHYLLVALATSQAAEGRAYELRILAREAELKALKAQIDPHFLFNSLNAISGLVVADPAATRHMCAQLASVLRDSLRFAAREAVSVEEEMALATSYLAIEQARFGDRLRVEQTVEDGCAPCTVPPLLLLPLVENAVKHGIAHLVAGGTVRLQAARQRGELYLAVENPCDPDRPPTAGERIGLANVRRRIEARFPDSGRMTVTAEPTRFRVALLLPFQPQREAAAAETPP